MTTNLADIHPEIIQTHILPLLDGPSLSSTATASPYLQTLCSDDSVWSHICNSTWPSTTDPRLHDIISTFPSGHRSFFQDSFPALVITADHHQHHHNHHLSSHPWPSQIISAVDIRYQNDIIYSNVEFTDTTDDFLSSELRIILNEDPGSKSRFDSINLKVDELEGADEATLMAHLKESMSLSWIVIDPAQKRAGNISSNKPVVVIRREWMNENADIHLDHLLYATVLPGCDENTMVQCRIKVVLGVDADARNKGLEVKEVMLELLDMEFCCLKGRDFLVITQGALSGENNVKRKMVDDDESRSRYLEFKRISIDSLSHLQSDTEKDMVMASAWRYQSFFQKLFHLLCTMLVVALLII